VEEPRDQGHDLLRNIAAGGMSSLVKAGLQLLMLPAMAVLLGPKEFGLYATVLPIVTFFTVIADGGLGASLAKERSADPAVWTTAFYVMLALGIGLAGVVNLCGFGLAHIMREPRLMGLMSLLSVSLLFIAVSTLPAARMYQRNDLVSFSVIDMLAAAIGAGVGLVFAYNGYGASSLAIQSVTTFGVRAVGLNVVAFEVPGRTFSLAALAGHVGTGGVLVGTRLVDMVCRFVENVLFSLAFGPAALGAYTFANQICRFFCESVSNPVWSATYAQALKAKGSVFAKLVRDMVQLVFLATFPIACLVAVAAPKIFVIVFGAKWVHAGPYLQVLICAYALSTAATIASAAFLATGENKLFLGTMGFLNIGRVLAVAAGPWIGSFEVVCLIAIAHLVYTGLTAVLVARTYHIPKRGLLAAGSSALIAGALGGCACALLLNAVPATHVTTVASVLVGAAVVLLCLIAIDENFTLGNVKGIVRRVLRRGAEV
jgi:PST family polysaccharide transporter